MFTNKFDPYNSKLESNNIAINYSVVDGEHKSLDPSTLASKGEVVLSVFNTRKVFVKPTYIDIMIWLDGFFGVEISKLFYFEGIEFNADSSSGHIKLR